MRIFLQMIRVAISYTSITFMNAETPPCLAVATTQDSGPVKCFPLVSLMYRVLITSTVY